MVQVILTVHLILALCLIVVVLLQRSEGGALGIGGGGGGLVTSRGAATALTRLTWIVAAGFIATSLLLTIESATRRGSSAVIGDQPIEQAPAGGGPSLPFTPTLPNLGDGPATPPAGAPAAPATPPGQ